MKKIKLMTNFNEQVYSHSLSPLDLANGANNRVSLTSPVYLSSYFIKKN